MTKMTEAGMRRDHRGGQSGSHERARRREREQAGEHRPGLAAEPGRGPGARSGAEAGRGPGARSGADGGRGTDASRPDGAQEVARIGDTISMMLDRLRDAAAAHDQDCAQDRD